MQPEITNPLHMSILAQLFLETIIISIALLIMMRFKYKCLTESWIWITNKADGK